MDDNGRSIIALAVIVVVAIAVGDRMTPAAANLASMALGSLGTLLTQKLLAK